ncbi:MAG: 50S ribosomal protein L35 [Patescibacteria group bacterium]
MKTNKSYAKRIKITKSGKLLTRKSGRNHFNAKERHQNKSAKRQNAEFHMTNKERSRFLVNIK